MAKMKSYYSIDYIHRFHSMFGKTLNKLELIKRFISFLRNPEELQIKITKLNNILISQNQTWLYNKDKDGYILETDLREKENKYECGVTFVLRFSEQDNWELAPDKFDITSLKPFDQVLVRDFDNTPWEIEFFSRLLDGKQFKCFELSYVQCIPYKGNEHLLGKKDDCNKYFKTWE